MTDGIEAPENENIVTCRLCQRRLRYGADVWNGQQGVLGPRGFVAVEDPVLFCSEKCLSANFGTAVGQGEDGEERVP